MSHPAIMLLFGAGQPAWTHTVTIGSGGGAFGYQGFGAVAPTTLNARTILQLVSIPGSNTLRITLDGVVTQNFFNQILVEGTNGVIYRFLTADAFLFENPGGVQSRWTWLGADYPWTALLPSPRRVAVS